MTLTSSSETNLNNSFPTLYIRNELEKPTRCWGQGIEKITPHSSWMVEACHFNESWRSTEWIVSEVATIRIEANSSISGISTTRQGTTQVCEHSIRLVSICDDDALEVVCLKEKHSMRMQHAIIIIILTLFSEALS